MYEPCDENLTTAALAAWRSRSVVGRFGPSEDWLTSNGLHALVTPYNSLLYPRQAPILLRALESLGCTKTLSRQAGYRVLDRVVEPSVLEVVPERVWTVDVDLDSLITFGREVVHMDFAMFPPDDFDGPEFAVMWEVSHEVAIFAGPLVFLRAVAPPWLR